METAGSIGAYLEERDEMLEGTPCEECGHEWAVRIPGDERVVTVPSGHLRTLDSNNIYSDESFPATCGNHLGFYAEYVGGDLAHLPRCVRQLFEVAEFEVLIEGRWIKMKTGIRMITEGEKDATIESAVTEEKGD